MDNHGTGLEIVGTMEKFDSLARFDSLAATWDVDPVHIARTHDVARHLRERIQLAGRRVLEVGAGTGLLSFALSEDVGSVLAVDPSPGMVSVLVNKIRQSGSGNIQALRCGDDLVGLDGLFDVVMLQMALHHVQDVQAFLVRAASILAPGGFLAIADLDTEDGTFHGPEVADIHLGFDRVQLVNQISLTGLEPVSIETAHVMRRTSDAGEKDYPIFLVVARKG